jgi:hypothetical protein
VSAVAAALALPIAAFAAFQFLPTGGAQVNNDPANSIDPNKDAGASDVVGGSLVAGTAPQPMRRPSSRSSSPEGLFRAVAPGSRHRAAPL